jgi:hypothetical protein
MEMSMISSCQFLAQESKLLNPHADDSSELSYSSTVKTLYFDPTTW